MKQTKKEMEEKITHLQKDIEDRLTTDETLSAEQWAYLFGLIEAYSFIGDPSTVKIYKGLLHEL